MEYTRNQSAMKYEEAVSCYREVNNQLEASLSATANTTTDNNGYERKLFAKSILARCSAQCAILAEEVADYHDKENKKNHSVSTAGVRQLLEQTRLGIDQDATKETHVRPLLSVLKKNKFCKTGNNKKYNEKELDLIVDDFFESYPECRRSEVEYESSCEDDNYYDGEDDSSSDDDDGNENSYNNKRLKQVNREDNLQTIDLTKTNKHSLTKPDVGAKTNNTCGLVNSDAYGMKQKQQPRNSNDCKISSNRPMNPYTRKPQNNRDAGTVKSSSSALSTTTNHIMPLSTQAGENRNRMNDASSNNMNPRSECYNGWGNDNTSWESYQNQQNSFQTAREYAQGKKSFGDDASNSISNENVNASGRHQPPPRYSNNSNCDKESYQTFYGELEDESAYPINDNRNFDQPRRSVVPDSLKRKFQAPIRNSNQKVGQRSNSATVESAKRTGKVSKRNVGNTKTQAPSTGGQHAKPYSINDSDDEEELPEELRGLDKELVDKIQNEIMEGGGEPVTFSDIAGLKDAKQTVLELVIWPMKRPDLFTGLRRVPNGLLLFGPPGTGKTLIGKAIAHESGATFFSISSSSLTSKWIGEGEKLVRTLFAVAAYKEPAVVFIDEIDSLLTQRKADENEASRRIKTEFLVQLDGTGTGGQGRVLVIGATNRPHELDDAARRRFVKRLYIPLPEKEDRNILLRTLVGKNRHQLTDDEMIKLSNETNGFSGADLKALCTDAAMGPIRQLGSGALEVSPEDIPAISYRHFKRALRGMKPSVAQSDLDVYLEWNKTYGSKGQAGAGDDDDTDEEEDS